MFNIFGKRHRYKDIVDLVEVFDEHLSSSTEADPCDDEEFAALTHAYGLQTETLEALVRVAEQQEDVILAARNLLSVMAQRTAGESALFLINEDHTPGEGDLLRHAIVALQATLEGSLMPPMVTVDTVIH